MAISFPFHSSLVSSVYGARTWNGNPTFHTGIDFAVAGNREVKAADSGTITRVEYTALKGYQLEITHNAAAKTRYHMLRNDLANTVTEGQYVQKGQTVGHVAPVRYSTSAAWTGPHLHWEVWLKTNSSTGPTGNWFHWDPQNRATNAGGSGGYTPSEMPSTDPATGGGTTPIESDDMFSDGDRNLLKEVRDLLTPGQAGVKFDGQIYAAIQALRSDLTKVVNLMTPGQAGVRSDGDIFARVRDIQTRLDALSTAVSAASAEATAAKDHSKRGADAVTPGQAGVRHDGVLFALTKTIDGKVTK